jgi:hypothetical protein
MAAAIVSSRTGDAGAPGGPAWSSARAGCAPRREATTATTADNQTDEERQVMESPGQNTQVHNSCTANQQESLVAHQIVERADTAGFVEHPGTAGVAKTSTVSAIPVSAQARDSDTLRRSQRPSRIHC